MHLGIRRFTYGKGIICLVIMAAFFSGCASKEDDEKTIVLVEQEPEAPEYSLAAVTVGEVSDIEKLDCRYRQAEEQEVSFLLSGRQVAAVYVEKGDSVVKGQLLAELGNGTAEERMQTLEYQLERNRLLMENAAQNEECEISASWLQYLYRSGKTEAEEDALKEKVEEIQRKYRYITEDCQDAISLDRQELEMLREEAAQSKVYSQVDGTVSYLKKDLEGSTSTQGELIMTVMDGSKCVFECDETEYADYFREGDEVLVKVGTGNSAQTYCLVPWERENWGEKMLFTLAEEAESAAVEVGATGTIQLVLDSRQQVLRVPKQAVHEADGRAYVYVLGAEQLREVKWIKAGLYGDEYVQVISGLKEGEKVIIK